MTSGTSFTKSKVNSMAPVSLYFAFSFLGSSTHSLRAMVDFLPSSSSLSSTLTPVSSAKKAWFRRSLMEYLRDAHTKHRLWVLHRKVTTDLATRNTHKAQLCVRSQIVALTSHSRDRSETRQDSEGNLWLHNSLSHKRRDDVKAHIPLLPSVADTFPNDFLNFWIADFTVTGGFHPLQDKRQIAWRQSDNSVWNELIYLFWWVTNTTKKLNIFKTPF